MPDQSAEAGMFPDLQLLSWKILGWIGIHWLADAGPLVMSGAEVAQRSESRRANFGGCARCVCSELS
jgi:hypothetical protein